MRRPPGVDGSRRQREINWSRVAEAGYHFAGIALPSEAITGRDSRVHSLKAFACDCYVVPLPAGHRFPIEKYALLREAVLDAGLMTDEGIVVPEPATDEQILRVHDPNYLEKVKKGCLSTMEVRRMGFPWSPKLVKRARCSVGGTISACRSALEDGVAVNLAGGTHHAFRDRGEGYCIFNDIRTMQVEGRARQAVILDGDVHQGNGTAALTATDPTVFTFSIHSARNYPLRKTRSDLDIGLPDGAGDAVYLEAFERGRAARSSSFWCGSGYLPGRCGSLRG